MDDDATCRRSCNKLQRVMTRDKTPALSASGLSILEHLMRRAGPRDPLRAHIKHVPA